MTKKQVRSSLKITNIVYSTSDGVTKSNDLSPKSEESPINLFYLPVYVTVTWIHLQETKKCHLRDEDRVDEIVRS